MASPMLRLVAEPADVAAAARQLDRVQHDQLPRAQAQGVVALAEPELLQRERLAAERVAVRARAGPAVVVADRMRDRHADLVVDPPVRGPLRLDIGLARVQRVVDRVAALEDQVRAVAEPELQRALGERLGAWDAGRDVRVGEVQEPDAAAALRNRRSGRGGDRRAHGCGAGAGEEAAAGGRVGAQGDFR
jgi:hypothetical protein